jgi:hypothetical protein
MLSKRPSEARAKCQPCCSLANPWTEYQAAWPLKGGAAIIAEPTPLPSALPPLSLLCSGARRASTVYDRIVRPVFRASGCKTSVRETEYAGHAQQMVEALGLDDVEGIDGGPLCPVNSSEA